MKISLDTDIRSLSEFRSSVTGFIDSVKKTRRPMVITQHGKSAAVLLDVTSYQKLLDELDLLQEIQIAENQLDNGKGISHSKVLKKFGISA